jgi:Family of unknown function (DUF6318)
VRDLRWTVAGLVVATVLLGGCSEKQEANDTLPTTSAAETTETLPEVGPADFPVPDEARTQDAAGAKAFAYYWVDLLNQQREVPEGQPLRDLGPECEECLRIAQNYDEAAAAGHRYEGGTVTITSMADPIQRDGNTHVNFIARADAVRLVNSAGEEVTPGPAGADLPSSGVGLAWSDDLECWLVAGFTLG